ncbi:hypothetical protein FJZ53_06265 [Candidatus Woesearchaeota archaeon]|nr:hypothetical protein [Candidatus Woesearchaeota archaeon]
MTKAYSGKSGSPKSTGTYGLEGGLKGLDKYNVGKNKSIGQYGLGPRNGGMAYIKIEIGYQGNLEDIAQGLQQYLPLLGQYLNTASKGYGQMFQGREDHMSPKGFFKPTGYSQKDGAGVCEMCGKSTPEGMRRCPTCSLVMSKYLERF